MNAHPSSLSDREQESASGVGPPTYYVRHPDDSYSVADPQPTLGVDASAALAESGTATHPELLYPSTLVEGLLVSQTGGYYRLAGGVASTETQAK